MFFSANTALSAEKQDLFIQFDPRERIPKPDLSMVGRVRFLTSVDFPPFNFIDQTGRLAGFHVDLAREICRELDIIERCQIQAMPFKDLQAALDRGDGDVVAAGVAMTPETRADHLFSRVYLQLPARFMAIKGTGRPPTVQALDGLTVGVGKGTRHEAMLKAFFPAIKAMPMDGREMLEAMKTGKVTAVFGDGRQLAFWAGSPEAANCCQALGGPYYSSAFLGDGMGLMLRGTDDVLAQAINHALLELARKGRLEEIYLRYFPNGI